jgi:hypothetical protein
MSESASIGSLLAARVSQKQKRTMIQTIVLFIIGLSVVLSYQYWETPPSFRAPPGARRGSSF